MDAGENGCVTDGEYALAVSDTGRGRRGMRLRFDDDDGADGRGCGGSGIRPSAPIRDNSASCGTCAAAASGCVLMPSLVRIVLDLALRDIDLFNSITGFALYSDPSRVTSDTHLSSDVDIDGKRRIMRIDSQPFDGPEEDDDADEDSESSISITL